MRTPVDARLLEEADRYAYRFACDDCAHFEATTARCSLAYPAQPRRDALGGRYLELCKAFELG